MNDTQKTIDFHLDNYGDEDEEEDVDEDTNAVVNEELNKQGVCAEILLYILASDSCDINKYATQAYEKYFVQYMEAMDEDHKIQAQISVAALGSLLVNSDKF
mmetsp:Transcript_36594/g.32807  ORF Transcript_36594/g.32807 Transcript_36594/m.32807 type:complete len:102 (+) Transcript_36594:736-1041(+)|eukprot:CAMPEP_0114578856 /NCGR_PEP_ID=MMETSP0125-20121206/3345_1 /TAXON_ID=485358 ORGANISM="Aristerostoma sp., Strain ATCC 50986" /NCGR_SAMPLE_ID=MMETSP0125 /ASSEMBLY_ACC=CAM_ASM_000245 /LENGTH=101 /DNA_ID=CAMNT_0001769243 /DNA_START=2407 /DNA_END=2712 /DNA_ORIENTATION=+